MANSRCGIAQARHWNGSKNQGTNNNNIVCSLRTRNTRWGVFLYIFIYIHIYKNKKKSALRNGTHINNINLPLRLKTLQMRVLTLIVYRSTGNKIYT